MTEPKQRIVFVKNWRQNIYWRCKNNPRNEYDNMTRIVISWTNKS